MTENIERGGLRTMLRGQTQSAGWRRARSWQTLLLLLIAVCGCAKKTANGHAEFTLLSVDRGNEKTVVVLEYRDLQLDSPDQHHDPGFPQMVVSGLREFPPEEAWTLYCNTSGHFAERISYSHVAEDFQLMWERSEGLSLSVTARDRSRTSTCWVPVARSYPR